MDPLPIPRYDIAKIQGLDVQRPPIQFFRQEHILSQGFDMIHKVLFIWDYFSLVHGF